MIRWEDVAAEDRALEALIKHSGVDRMEGGEGWVHVPTGVIPVCNRLVDLGFAKRLGWEWFMPVTPEKRQ